MKNPDDLDGMQDPNDFEYQLNNSDIPEDCQPGEDLPVITNCGRDDEADGQGNIDCRIEWSVNHCGYLCTSCNRLQNG